MKTEKHNLHRDYEPFKVVDYMKSPLVRGMIVKLRFWKVRKLTLLQFLWFPRRFKDIYFWLPYKNVVDTSTKYSVLGSKSRFPYANIWFEVKPTSEIYEQGLNDFIFKQKAIAKHTNEIRTMQPFLTSELLTLTRKKVIKRLDDFLFNKTMKQQFKK